MTGLLCYAAALALWCAAVASARLSGLRHRLVGVFALGAVMVVVQWTAAGAVTPHRYRDFFRAYLYAGCQVVRHPGRLYDFPDRGRPGGFVNVPIVAYLFAPLCRVDRSHALASFNALGNGAALLALVALVWLARPSGVGAAAVGGLWVANAPLYYDVVIGNTSRTVLLVLILAALLLQNEKRWLAGALVGLAAVVKLPLLLLGGYFAARRQRAELTGFLLAVALVMALSLCLFGPELHLTWYRRAVAPYSTQPIAAFNDQGLGSVLLRLRGEGDLASWYPIAVSHGARNLRTFLAAVLVAGAATCWWRMGPIGNEALDLAGLGSALCLVLVVSPVSWTHYFVLLLLPLSLYAAGRLPVPPGPGWRRVLTVAAFLVSAPPLRSGAGVPVLDGLVHRVLASSTFCGALLLLLVLLASGMSIRGRISAMHGGEEHR